MICATELSQGRRILYVIRRLYIVQKLAFRLNKLYAVTCQILDIAKFCRHCKFMLIATPAKDLENGKCTDLVKPSTKSFHYFKDWYTSPLGELSCPHCDFTIDRHSRGARSHLKRHINDVHLGLKRFHCDLCGRYFARNENLRRHQKSVHWD